MANVVGDALALMSGGFMKTEAVGACDYPAVGDVELGVAFNSGANVGTFVSPAEADVRLATTYGASAEFTGSLIAPVAASASLITESVQDALLVFLNIELVGEDATDPLREIKIATFDGAEALRDILKDHGPRMPGGFLSIPEVSWNSDQQLSIARVMATMTFRFAAITEDARDTPTRATFAHSVIAKTTNAVAGKEIAAGDLPTPAGTWATHRVVLGESVAFEQIPGGEWYAVVFSIVVTAWKDC